MKINWIGSVVVIGSVFAAGSAVGQQARDALAMLQDDVAEQDRIETRVARVVRGDDGPALERDMLSSKWIPPANGRRAQSPVGSNEFAYLRRLAGSADDIGMRSFQQRDIGRANFPRRRRRLDSE